MINTVNTLGLNVITVKPSPYMNEVSINSAMEIAFNSDLDTKTIFGNVMVLKDTDMVYDGSGQVGDLSKYAVVNCTITYKDKVVYLTPQEQLHKATRYLIYVRPFAIKDVLGSQMQLPYISVFYTENFNRLPKAVVTTPLFGGIHPVTPEFRWEDQQTSGYIVQLSASSSFETLIIDEVISTPQDATFAPSSYQYPSLLTNGLYYLRVKALTGEWSDTTQFFIRQQEDTPISHDDTPYLDIAEEQELEVLEMFPEDGFSNVGTNVKLMYLKVSGIVEGTDFDKRGSYVEGVLTDYDDYETITPHGEVSGQWEVVAVREQNVSYIIFQMDEI